MVQRAGNPGDRGSADAGLVVDPPVRQPAIEQPNHGPAIRQLAELGRRAQVGEESLTLVRIAKLEHCAPQRPPPGSKLPLGTGWLWLHDSVITCYHTATQASDVRRL